MQGVLQGFGVVLILIAVGLAAARFLPQHREPIARGMTPLIYYITNPALMFYLLLQTDLREVIGVFTPIALLTAMATGGTFALVAKLALGLPASRLPAAAMSTSYVNAGNIGVPMMLYAVGTTNPVVSVLIAQLLVIAPIYLVLFSLAARSGLREGQGQRTAATILRSVCNPVTIATFAGAVFSLLDWQLPEVLFAPIEMLGNASIPLLLVAFGLALHGQRPLSDKSLRAQFYLATTFKVLLMPAIAWAIAHLLFGVSGTALLGVVIMAALPTAQNVLLFSQQFRVDPAIPREVILASTLLTVPVVLLAVFCLG